MFAQFMKFAKASLPVVNETAVYYAMQLGRALRCSVNRSVFARKQIASTPICRKIIKLANMTCRRTLTATLSFQQVKQ